MAWAAGLSGNAAYLREGRRQKMVKAFAIIAVKQSRGEAQQGGQCVVRKGAASRKGEREVASRKGEGSRGASAASAVKWSPACMQHATPRHPHT